MGMPVGNPNAIHLHVSAEAGETDELGGTAAIIDAVSAGLDERGLRYRLYTSDEDRPHPPLIDIRVERWNPGDRTLHGAAEGAGFLSPIAQAAMSEASAGGFVVFSRLVQDGEQEPRAIFMYSG